MHLEYKFTHFAPYMIHSKISPKTYILVLIVAPLALHVAPSLMLSFLEADDLFSLGGVMYSLRPEKVVHRVVY